jgi:prepilin-type N-terminal cleavage/methylation domain-containing protein
MMNKYKSHQTSGFTLLELIVVIAILALLSLGALVVYDGLTDKAQATISTRNAVGLNLALRQYRSTTLKYPDKWDVLVANDGSANGTTPNFLSTTTQAKFASAPLNGTGISAAVQLALQNVGINNLMVRTTSASTTSVEPNDQFNSLTANTSVLPVSSSTIMSILPTYASTTGALCKLAGTTLPAYKLDGVTQVSASDGLRQNVINPDLGTDTCSLVLALGFGREAARSTNGASVDLTTAALYVSTLINPAKVYARYIALFLVGQDGDNNQDIISTEFLTKAKLLTVLDPEGKTIEENIMLQNK